MPEVAELIRDARADAGITQSELARRAGTSQPTVAHYEAGRVEPSLSTLTRLLRACGYEIEMTARPGAPALPSQRLHRHRRAVLNACSRAGFGNVRVFGSIARHQDTIGSDVDLLVDLLGDATLLEIAALREELAVLLDAPVDIATPELLKPGVLRSALSEAVPL
jgi:uncharacterized protein